MRRAFLLLFLASCVPRVDAGDDVPCEVDELLASRCRSCHGEKPMFGAPMSLAKLEDVRKYSAQIKARIRDDKDPMPPRPNARLSPAQLARLDEWLGQGAPGALGCATDGGVTTPPALSCKPDTEVRPGAPHPVPATGDDEYVCYGFEPKAGPKRHVIGIAPRVDATAVVHHLTLLISETPVDPTPAPCPIAGSSKWRSVFGWAPGGNSFELPKEAGFPLDENAHYVVQVHYSNATRVRDARDASGFDLCTTTALRPNDADVMAFGTHTFTIPPKAPLDLSCSVQVPVWGATTHLFAAFPHMHQLGTSVATTVVSTTGQKADLGTQKNWDFGNQTWLPIDFVLRPGDTVTTRCAWNNTTDSYVTFGEKTTDEMCYGFVMYYPRIDHPSWHWSSPAVSSICTPK